MARVVAFIDQGFDGKAYSKTRSVVKKRGHKWMTVALKAGTYTADTGKEVTAKAIEDIKPCTAIFMVGGPCKKALKSEDTVDLLKQARLAGLIIASVGTGVRLLTKAKVLNGMNVAAPQSMVQEVEAATGVWHDAPCIVDGLTLTATDTKVFGNMLLEMLEE